MSVLPAIRFSLKGRDLGYGYRTGQMLAQVISSYTIKITVQIGKVANMVIDNLWDIIDQEP